MKHVALALLLITTHIPAAYADHNCGKRVTEFCPGPPPPLAYILLVPHLGLATVMTAGSGHAVATGVQRRGWGITSITVGSATTILGLAGVILLSDPEVTDQRAFSGVTLVMGLASLALGATAVALDNQKRAVSVLPVLDVRPDQATAGILMHF